MLLRFVFHPVLHLRRAYLQGANIIKELCSAMKAIIQTTLTEQIKREEAGIGGERSCTLA